MVIPSATICLRQGKRRKRLARIAKQAVKTRAFQKGSSPRRQPAKTKLLSKTTTMLTNCLSRADREGVVGYEVMLNFNGLPYRLTPRAASEMIGKSAFQLLSVNEAEQQKNPCRRLVVRRGAHWELTSHGIQLLELLRY